MADFNQVSDPGGIVSSAGEAVLGEWKSTLTAPSSFGEYRFYGWYDQYAQRYSNAMGRAQNPASVRVLENMTLTARYVSGAADADSDAVPDWFELYHYGDLSHSAASDTDGDGYALYEEWYRNTDPNTANAAVTWRYREQSLPGSLFATSEVYCAQSVTGRVSSSRYGEINGYRFTHWALNGVRLADALGRADDPIRTAFADPIRAYVLTANYTHCSSDTDSDGVPDWFELHYDGNLSRSGADDADGDGLTLAVECQHDTHPALADTLLDHRVAGGSSGSFTFVSAEQFTFDEISEPPGLIDSTEIATGGSVVTGTVAVLTWGDYHFCYWLLDGAPQTNADGSAVNPVIFAVTNDMVATALYLPLAADSDADLVPDWFELYHYGDLSHSAISDADGDGYTLYEEWYRNTDPNTADAAITWRYREQSLPGGLFTASEVYCAQSATGRVSSTRYGEIGGYRFTHWTLNGARLADGFGRADDPVETEFVDPTRAYVLTANYMDCSSDSDSDGVSDWFELHYNGDLLRSGSDDADGDGITLAAECQHDTHPALADTLMDHRVAVGGSAAFSCMVVPTAEFAFHEVSEPAGLIDTTTTEPGGSTVTGAVASLTLGDYRFCYWLLDGVCQTNTDGSAENPVVFVITNDTVATALYLPSAADSDEDLVPDWFELYHYGDLSRDSSADTDADGYTLYEEWYRNTDPNALDGTVAWRYREQAAPGGLFATSETYYAQSVTGRVSSTRYGEIGGYRFTHWTLNGARLADGFGRADDPVETAFADPSRAYELTANYMDGSSDSDSDGVSDWFELHYKGDLSRSGLDDADGDGFSLAVECRHDTHPALADTLVDHRVSGGSSEAFIFWQREYFELASSILVGGTASNLFSTGSTGVNGPGHLFGTYSYPALGDWDGDGDLDLFVGAEVGSVSSTSSACVVYANRGTVIVPDLYEVTTNFSDMASAWSSLPRPRPFLGDWNNDGRADLVMGGLTGAVRIISSTAHFDSPQVPVVSYLLEVGGDSTIPALLDVSADGYADLLVMKPDGLVSVYTNTHSPTVPFEAPAATENLFGEAVPGSAGMTVADVNGDGAKDVLVSDSEGRIWDFSATGGTFSLRSKVYGGTGAGFRGGLTATAGDFDGDGDSDVMGGGNDGQLIYLRNPVKHLRLTPALVTVGAGETVAFDSIDDNGTLQWSMPVGRSGGAIDPASGMYQAGATSGVDQVQACNAAGRLGVAWVNVVDRRIGGADKWRALLVDGRRGPNDPVWPAAHALNARAREVLRYRGLTADQILWLGHGETNAGPAALPTRAALASAMRDGSTLATNTETLLIYLVDHGRVAPNGDGVFLLSETESVTGPELDAWVDTLQAARPDLSVVVVIESCYGWRVAGPLAVADAFSDRRLVLASSGANELSHLAAGGLVSYSTMWWSGVASGKTFGDAHDDAKSAMASLQDAQLGGGALLAGSRLGLSGVTAAGRPVVSAIEDDIELQGAQEVRLSVNIESPFAVERAWGVVVPPGYRASGDTPVVDLAEIDLARDGASGQWTALAGGFTEGGAPYTVLVQARDVWGQVSAPTLIRVTQAAVRNRVIIFAHGEVAWTGAAAAGSLAAYAREVALLRHVRAEDVMMIADGVFGLDSTGPATPASLQDAIEAWANADGQLAALTIFAVGHGSQTGLSCANGDTVTPAAVKGWLDGLQMESGALVQLIVDSDYSGRFVGGAGSSEYRRVVISGTGSDECTTFSSGQWGGVMSWIWNSIARGRDLRESYSEATDLLQMIGVTVPALFDDNGDGTFSKLQEGLGAINAFVGSAYVTADDPPFIGRASAAMRVASGQRARFWVSGIVMPDGAQPASVWYEVIGPDGIPRGGGDLWPNLAKDRYEGSSGAFNEPGRYAVLVQAGTRGNPARTTPPAAVLVDYDVTADNGAPVTEGIPALALSLDGRSMDVESDAGGEWRLTLTRGQRVIVEAREVSSTRDVALQMVGAGGKVLASSDVWGLGFGESFDGWEAPADGTYVVRARFAPGGGAAECKVRAYIKRDAGGESLVALLPQTIAFTLPAEHSLDGGPLALSASTSSGLPPRFEVLSGPASITGTVLTAKSEGAVIVRALQDGNDEWDSAEPVVRTFTITAATNSYETWAREIFGEEYLDRGGPDQDFDGDGCSNRNEWRAKTDPRDPGDRFEICATACDAATFAVRWLAREGVNYRVTLSADFTAWIECPRSRITGAGTEVELELDASGPGKYYRIEVVDP